MDADIGASRDRKHIKLKIFDGSDSCPSIRQKVANGANYSIMQAFGLNGGIARKDSIVTDERYASQRVLLTWVRPRETLPRSFPYRTCPPKTP